MTRERKFHFERDNLIKISLDVRRYLRILEQLVKMELIEVLLAYDLNGRAPDHENLFT